MSEFIFKVSIPELCQNTEGELTFDEQSYPEVNTAVLKVGKSLTGCKPEKVQVVNKTKKFTRTWVIQFKPNSHNNHRYNVKVLYYQKTEN